MSDRYFIGSKGVSGVLDMETDTDTQTDRHRQTHVDTSIHSALTHNVRIHIHLHYITWNIWDSSRGGINYVYQSTKKCLVD